VIAECQWGARIHTTGNVLFGLSVAVVAFSLGGTWAIANMDVPDADYARLSQALGIANILLATGACIAWSWAAQGPLTTVVLLSLCMAIAGGMETLGVLTGVPFGHYTYTEVLGPKVGGLVPAVIPMAWFMMVYPALHIAEQTRLGSIGKGALVGAAMVAWDLALDPAMTADFGAWEWQQGGMYYGIPLQNYLGWFLTAFGIVLAFRAIPLRWRADRSAMPAAAYVVQGAFAGWLTVLYGRPGAAVAWLAAVALLWLVARRYASWERSCGERAS